MLNMQYFLLLSAYGIKENTITIKIIGVLIALAIVMFSSTKRANKNTDDKDKTK